VKIVAVAIQLGNLTVSLPAPARHRHILHMYFDATGTKLPPEADSQGFLTDEGMFVSRRAALRIATQAGQLLPDREVIGDKLYSENLW
jgi:hypothetical protein